MASTEIIHFIHHLKVAKEFSMEFQRQFTDTRGAAIFKTYENRINWIFNDIITNPNFDRGIVQGIKEELASDAFIVPAIIEKAALLKPDQRAVVEDLLDSILEGKTINVVLQSTGE